MFFSFTEKAGDTSLAALKPLCVNMHAPQLQSKANEGLVAEFLGTQQPHRGCERKLMV